MLRQLEAINTISDLLIRDNRVNAMFLKGSIARGEGDEYSDVDFYCIVNENDLDSFLKDRKSILESYKTLVDYSEVYFVAPQVVGIFNNGLHFDLYTITKEPNEGTDPIKIVYDPNNLLINYQVVENKEDVKDVAEYVNEFSYTLVEVEAAYKRNDLLWSYRLGSHLIAGLSCVLCYIYNKKASFIGMKKLSSKLPEDINNKLINANINLSKNYIQGIKDLIDIQETVINKLEDEIKEHINMEFLYFMKTRIYEIK